MRPAGGGPRIDRRGHWLRATAVRKRDIRTALKGIDAALKALEMFAKLSGQLQGLALNGQAEPDGVSDGHRLSGMVLEFRLV